MAESSKNLNNWLIRACAVLIVIDLLHIPLGLASIPRFYQRVTTLTIPIYGAGIGNPLTNQSVLAQAAERGMSLSTIAVYFLGVQLFAALIFSLIGGLVLWRARDHWFGWFTAHVMLFLNGYAFYPPIQVAHLLPAGITEVGSLFWPTFVIYFFLFPNGRAVPNWMRWPILIYGLFHFSFQLSGILIQAGLIPEEMFQVLLPLFEGFVLTIFVLVFACQIYRYMRVSSRVERAQTNWILLGMTVFVFVPSFAGLFGITRIFRTFEWGTLSLVIAPTTLAIAILRYRLWDIDVIIRRTLQYSLVTGLLALVYLGSVLVGQRIAGALTGEPDSTLVLVISTLLIAALFNPLRIRLQDFIDRRFYRRKYDAEKALVRFAASIRDDVDIKLLRTSLIGVAAETMQPEQVNLWLKSTTENLIRANTMGEEI